MQIVDTVLAKLFARGEKTTDLDALLDESDLVVLPEVEPVFRAMGLYNALCKIYSNRGHDAELLELWSKCAGSPLRQCLHYFCFSRLEPQTC